MFLISITMVVLVIILIYFTYCYNDFISVKNNVDNAWANINVLLKQRHDELTKLIDLCKQYMDYEAETLKDIIAAREGVENAYAQHNVKTLNNEEKHLQTGMKNLLALAENYPSLRANTSFQQIGESIHSLETRIAERRELYNANVNINNILIDQFPTIVIAKICNFGKLNLLDFSEEEKFDINIPQSFIRD